MAPSPEWTLEESRAGTGLRQWVGHGRARPAQNEAADASEDCEPALHAPRRWGLSAEAVAHLGDRLCQVWRRLRGCLTPRTCDPSERAYDDLRAQWPMDPERHLANMDRPLHGGDGQALPHVMSHSPWSGPAVFEQRQAEIKAPPALAQGSPLMLWDEFQAQQYRAWEHHLARTAAAWWCVAHTKWVWAQRSTGAPALAFQLAVEVWPALSTANGREWWKAVLPLPQLTPQRRWPLSSRL